MMMRGNGWTPVLQWRQQPALQPWVRLAIAAAVTKIMLPMSQRVLHIRRTHFDKRVVSDSIDKSLLSIGLSFVLLAALGPG